MSKQEKEIPRRYFMPFSMIFTSYFFIQYHIMVKQFEYLLITIPMMIIGFVWQYIQACELEKRRRDRK